MTFSTFKKLSLTLAIALSLTACNNIQPLESTKSSTTIDTKLIPSDNNYPSWSYSGDTGATHWGDTEGNELCKSGPEQSPINIKKVLKTNDTAPIPTYLRSDIEIVNNGHTIVYTPKSSLNTITIDGELYNHVQFHYHTPSEHQISGTNYPGELHFVHANVAGELAVIGVMLNATATVDTILTKLLDSSLAATMNMHQLSFQQLK